MHQLPFHYFYGNPIVSSPINALGMNLPAAMGQGLTNANAFMANTSESPLNHLIVDTGVFHVLFRERDSSMLTNVQMWVPPICTLESSEWCLIYGYWTRNDENQHSHGHCVQFRNVGSPHFATPILCTIFWASHRLLTTGVLPHLPPSVSPCTTFTKPTSILV